jgi:hypothetical protein
MKVSFNIPDDLYRELQERADSERITIQEAILECIRLWLLSNESSEA